MVEENKNELIELRSQIVARTKLLALDGTGTPESRLQILLEVIRSGESTLDIYKTTFGIIQQLSNDDEKLDAMLDLVFEIDKDLAAKKSE